MIKRLKKKIEAQYTLVKKFSTVLEARLAEETLRAYHIKTLVVRHYHGARLQIADGMREIQLLVSPQDYQLAYRLLYA